MIATLAPHSIKTFARSLRFLATIGNEIFFKSLPEGLILQAVNSSKTCFCTISLNKGFFIRYGVTGENYEENHFVCPMRPLLTIFRNVKTILSCQFLFDAKKDKLIFDIGKPKDGEIRHVISILDYDDLDIDIVQANDLKNKLVFKPDIMANLLNTIPKNLRELAFDISEDRLEIRNHISHPDKDVQTVRLKFPLYSTEFIEYHHDSEDALIIVSSKDFLSILEFAESSGDELKIVYATNGHPLTASVEKDSTFKIQLVMATIREETLRAMRKPAGVTSYRELMETRLSAGGVKSPIENVSTSEANKIISPLVSTFQSTSCKNKESSKRKNAELKTNNDEPLKKQKSNNVILSQKDQEEVSQVISDLLMNNDEDDNLLGDNSKSPYVATNSNFACGKGFKIVPRPNSSTADSGSDNITSQRLVLKRSLPILQNHCLSSTSNHEQEKTVSQRLRLRESNRNAKRLFSAVLNTRSHNVNMGETLAENSDSDDGMKELTEEPASSQAMLL